MVAAAEDCDCGDDGGGYALAVAARSSIGDRFRSQAYCVVGGPLADVPVFAVVDC